MGCLVFLTTRGHRVPVLWESGVKSVAGYLPHLELGCGLWLIPKGCIFRRWLLVGSDSRLSVYFCLAEIYLTLLERVDGWSLRALSSGRFMHSLNWLFNHGSMMLEGLLLQWLEMLPGQCTLPILVGLPTMSHICIQKPKISPSVSIFFLFYWVSWMQRIEISKTTARDIFGYNSILSKWLPFKIANDLCLF